MPAGNVIHTDQCDAAYECRSRVTYLLLRFKLQVRHLGYSGRERGVIYFRSESEVMAKLQYGQRTQNWILSRGWFSGLLLKEVYYCTWTKYVSLSVD
jgi:hypothetical protein